MDLFLTTREKGEEKTNAQIHILNDWMNGSTFKLGQIYRRFDSYFQCGRGYKIGDVRISRWGK